MPKGLCVSLRVEVNKTMEECAAGFEAPRSRSCKKLFFFFFRLGSKTYETNVLNCIFNLKQG